MNGPANGRRPVVIAVVGALLAALLGAVGGLVAMVFGWLGEGHRDHEERLRARELEASALRQAVRRLEACHINAHDGTPPLACHVHERPEPP